MEKQQGPQTALAGIKNARQLGEYLRGRRKAAGVTQRRFAELAGIDPAQLSRLENGIQGVRLQVIQALLAVLNLELVIRSKPGKGGEL